MAEVHNKNASGEPSRLQPKSPWQDLGSRAASAGEEIMKFLTPPAPPAKSTQYIQPQPQATKDRRPGYIQDMDTDTMRQDRVNALSDPSRAGETSAFRKQYLGENAAPYAPAPQSAPQEPEPSDDPFTAFVDKTKSEKEARRQTMQAQQPAGNALPPPHMWDGSWKNNTSQAKNPNNAIDPALAAQLEAETATRENLRIPGNSNAPKESAFTINPDAIALPPESQAADGTVTSAQTPDSSVMGPDEAIDPALEGPAGGPLMGQSQYGFDLAETPPSDQVPIGEDPIDEEVMTGVLEGKTPTPETPAEEARIAYLMSKRGINADRELAGQDDIRAQIAQLRGYDQMDYRPLAALVDTWTGSKMAPSFAGPTDREPLIAQLNALIQKGNQHMTDAEMQELKDYNDNQTRLAVAKGKGTGADPMALLRERARLAGLQRESDHAWQDKRDIKKGNDAQTRAETYAGTRKAEKEERVALDTDNRDTALSEKLSDSPDSKGVGTISRLNAALVRYRKLLDGAGTSFTGGTFLADSKQKEIDAAYADYTALAKDEKVLGQLTASDRQIIQDTISSNTGLVALNDMFTGEGVSSIKKQIDGALDRLKVSSRDRVNRLRSVAGKGKNPRTQAYIDTIESELGLSSGMTSDEALAISAFKEQTRALAAQRAAKKKAESKGGTP